MTELSFERTLVAPRTWCCQIMRNLHRALLVCTVLWTPGWVNGQGAGCGSVCGVYGSLLLATERDLIDSIRTLEKVARPTVGPRNTRGRWVQREISLSTEVFDTIFYLKNGLVQRIEMTNTSSDAQCRSRTPWAATIAALEAWQGKDPISGQFDTVNSMHRSAHWAAGDLDVSAYLSITTDACSTKVALKKREAKDGAEL